MVRRSPLRFIEARLISTQVEPRPESDDPEIRVEVAKNIDSESGYWTRLSFEGNKAISLDLDTFREVNRAVESLVNAHHKRNGKAKKSAPVLVVTSGKGKGNAGSSA